MVLHFALRCIRTTAAVRRCVGVWVPIELHCAEHYPAPRTSRANYATSSTVSNNTLATHTALSATYANCWVELRRRRSCELVITFLLPQSAVCGLTQNNSTMHSTKIIVTDSVVCTSIMVTAVFHHRFLLLSFFFTAADCNDTPPRSATLTWWWGFAPMTGG